MITIVKCNHLGKKSWRYQGEILHREASWVVVEAYFNHPDVDLGGMMLCEGDRCFETFYSDRWYNIFEIYANEDDDLKGWYCNITRPAVIGKKKICYSDLALDLLILPDGRQVVLDEEEFNLLPLSQEERLQASTALRELQSMFVRDC